MVRTLKLNDPEFGFPLYHKANPESGKNDEVYLFQQAKNDLRPMADTQGKPLDNLILWKPALWPNRYNIH